MSSEGPSELVDARLDEEIELVARLVLAARVAPAHLSPAEIDRLLGVTSARSRPRRGTRRRIA